TLAVKAVVAGGALGLAGTPLRVAAVSAIYLAQVGEFSFVLGRDALRLGILGADTWQMLLPASILTMLATPPWTATAPGAADRITPARHQPALESEALATTTEHVIVLGFGVGGRLVASALREFGIPYTIIDLNGVNVREARATGEPIFYGDATVPDALLAAGVERARAVVVVLGDPDASLKIGANVRRLAPGVNVLVRARYRTEAMRLREAGAMAVAEELEASLEIVAQLLSALDVPGNIVQVLVEDYRRREEMVVVRQAAPPRMPLERIAPDLLSTPVATHQLRDGD